MNKTKKYMMMGSAISSVGMFLYKMIQMRKEKQKVLALAKDSRYKSEKADHTQSLKDTDMSQYDQGLKDEWHGMGYPQTHREIKNTDSS